MGKLHTTYRLTITTLSPLHIGTGTILRQGYDYVVHGGKTWVFDADVLAETLYQEDQHRFKQMADGCPAGDLIYPHEYKPDNPLFRYVLPGAVRAGSKGAELQEQLKDPWDRPYIPGSSLKGALRTALATVGWEQRKLEFAPDWLGDNPKTAAQPMEARVMYGSKTTPNYDLLRALQISDSTPGDKQSLQLFNVQVITGNKLASPIELEAIKRGITFEATLTLDGFLLKNDTARQLGWSLDDQLKWLRPQVITQIANKFSERRIEAEWKRWQSTNGLVRSFYRTLARQMGDLDRKSEFLLQLGWGGGWDSKTFAYVLTADDDKFYALVRKYRSQMDRQRSFELGDRFPKSRRLVVQKEQAFRPLGWIKVKMERVE